MLLGKRRIKARKKNSTPKKTLYNKLERISKPCGNSNCSNTFLGTENGNQEFCNRKCLRKVRGRQERKKN